MLAALSLAVVVPHGASFDAHASSASVALPEATALVGVVITLDPGERVADKGSGSFSFATGLGDGSAICTESLATGRCSVWSSGTRTGDLCTRGTLSGVAGLSDGDIWFYSVTFLAGRGFLAGEEADADGGFRTITGVLTVEDSPLAALSNANDCASEVLQQPQFFIAVNGDVVATG